ncbi:MAG: 2-phospho-L-lactate guanylyltransferase [Acidimicrobiales bacterium]
MLLIPVKAFHEAKSRLAESVVSPGRAALARSMATSVLRAGRQLRLAVVCDDERVARWAASNGALTLWKPGRGLNGAVTEAVEDLGAAGFDQVVVAHGDLPLAQSFSELLDFDGITLVPDRRRQGTNVICLPTGTGFEFSYGAGSFDRHLTEASRVATETRVVTDENLALDIDTPEDMEELRRR